MRGDSQGIQQLLTAEKRADEKITQAKKRKATRLKQAKEEAQAEIQKFKDEKETHFKQYEAQFKGSREDNAVKIDRETEDKIREMSQLVDANKDIITEYLLSQICLIDVKLHKNLRLP